MPRRHVAALLLLLPLFCLGIACMANDRPEATPFPTATAAASPETRRPTPTRAPGVGTYSLIGSEVRVWAYADTPEGSFNCTQLIGQMVPAGASKSPLNAGKTVACIITAGDTRVDYFQDDAGVFHLRNIQLILAMPEDLPPDQRGRTVPCRDIGTGLLSASAQASDWHWSVACDYLPPARDELPRQVIEVQGIIRKETPASAYPEDQPCYLQISNLGTATEAEGRVMRCSLP